MKEFSEREREYIREKLIEAGKACFSKQGIKKTSIEDLTKAARIAKGSFYAFFKSKEDLYSRILIDEIRSSSEKKAAMSDKSGLPPQWMLRKMISDSVESMDTNPILNLMLVPEEYQLVYRKLAAEGSHAAADIAGPLAALFREWQKAGLIIDKDPHLLAGVVKCLFLMTTHKKEIGEDIYSGVMAFLIDMVSEKLTARGNGIQP